MPPAASFGKAPATTTEANFVLLRDGAQAQIRQCTPDDRAQVEAFLEGLTPDSRMLRFHSAARVNPQMIDAAASGHALFAIVDGAVAALASYYRLQNARQAEIALAVSDSQQGRGIGTALFERLAADARAEGIQRFLALVMSENQPMIELLRGLGFRMTRSLSAGELEFNVELKENDGSIAQADARRHVAASASLDPLFQPKSVAVIGASRRPGTIGHEIFRNLLSGGFAGPVYPINPAAHQVASVRAFASVAEVPDQVDLAIISVPEQAVLSAAEEALTAGVRALVVVSAGFAEMGPEGRGRQDELLSLCRSHNARLVGPNCLGVLSNLADVSMNATFAPVKPAPGNLAIASQSGALGIAILDEARELGLGISAFVSMGNKADVSSNDLLERWEDDPATEVILLYLESFGNPRRFARVARRVGSKKPVIAIKGGRGAAGQRAAASHTAALAGSNVAVDALFRQAGVTQCETLEEAFDVSLLMANQPIPAGNRVGIVTNAGGLGILCADACEAHGLELPKLSPDTLARVVSLLPPHASSANPVDATASCPPETYAELVRTLLADPGIDAVIALFIPLATASSDELSDALAAACDVTPSTKPILACFAGRKGALNTACGRLVPLFSYPESAARALARAAERGVWLRRTEGHLPADNDTRQEAARAIAIRCLGDQASAWLKQEDVNELLATYGIRTPKSVIARSADEAAAAAIEVGLPVAVKLSSSRLLHKSDVGGVHLDVPSAAAAADAYRAIEASLAAQDQASAMEGALIQPMAGEGTECLVGVVSDPTFGPLIAFGLGGVTTEVLGDVAFRLHPLTDVDADELIRGIKAFRLLDGYRGRPKADLAALRELILAVSQMVEEVPEIAELDFNPVMVADKGALVLDARIRLAAKLATNDTNANRRNE